MPTRALDTSMWGDSRLVPLSPLAKLLFVRLVTGGEVGPHGGLKATPRRLAADLSGDDETVAAADVATALASLVESGLVRQYDDWLWLPQFLKHQMKSPRFARAVLDKASELPPSMAKAVRREVERVAETRKWSSWGEKEPQGQTPDKEPRSEQGKAGQTMVKPRARARGRHSAPPIPEDLSPPDSDGLKSGSLNIPPPDKEPRSEQAQAGLTVRAHGLSGRGEGSGESPNGIPPETELGERAPASVVVKARALLDELRENVTDQRRAT